MLQPRDSLYVSLKNTPIVQFLQGELLLLLFNGIKRCEKPNKSHFHSLFMYPKQNDE